MKWQTIIGVLVCLFVTYLGIGTFYDINDEIPGKDWTLRLGLDLQSGSHIAVKLLETKNPVTGELVPLDHKTQERSIKVFQKRLNPDGSKEVSITPEGSDRLIVELPGVTNLQEAQALVKKAGRLEFKERLYNPATGSVQWKTLLDGSVIQSAQAVQHPQTGWYISFKTTSQGAKQFEAVTRRLQGKPMGIFFDGQELSAPTVQSPISTDGSITGQYTAEEASELANFLNAGALPVDIEILESYTVSPTLGEQSVKTSMLAAAWGLLIVVLYMMLNYRMLGVVASIALAIYAVITLASMNLPNMEVVLTLPGIAGFILSIGMAVDANVLIFERIHEELRKGKKLLYAIDIGFDKAFSSIIDGHVTTFIGAAVLYWFGAVTVKGFGFTLMLGTFWSVLTATLVTRVFLDLCTEVFGWKSPSLYYSQPKGDK